MPHALFLSPHLDDVAFSCGGTLAMLLAAGWDATVATVFTASVAEPTGFALACQTDKGLAPAVDYMALRRAEDEAFAQAVGAALPDRASTLHLRHGPSEEAPHRGYASAAALFAGVREGDEEWKAVREWLRALADERAPALVFAPQGLGGHVDHLHVARAVRAWGEEAEAPPPVWWYRDVPYALRASDARPCRWAVPRSEAETRGTVRLTDGALEAKLRGAAAYETQLGFQFGGVASMRAALADFARAEARRYGPSGEGRTDEKIEAFFVEGTSDALPPEMEETRSETRPAAE